MRSKKNIKILRINLKESNANLVKIANEQIDIVKNITSKNSLQIIEGEWVRIVFQQMGPKKENVTIDKLSIYTRLTNGNIKILYHIKSYFHNFEKNEICLILIASNESNLNDCYEVLRVVQDFKLLDGTSSLGGRISYEKYQKAYVD